MTKTKPPAYFAIISDIHSNLDALDAVLADIDQWPCRGILCLGDIVGYGPEPAACVQRVMDRCAVSVLGNHEAMLFLSDQFPPEDFGASVGEPIALAAKQVSADQMAWLRGLPISADLDPIILSHTSLREPPNFHYIDNMEEVEAHFGLQTTFVSFHGHTHVPVVWKEKGGNITFFKPNGETLQLDEDSRYAINVGSVGQPRDNDPRASYALYDYEKRHLVHRRVDYDIARAQDRFKTANLPARNASRLEKGQ